MKTENIKISSALYAVLILITLFIGANAVISIISLGKIHGGTETMYNDRVIPLQQLKVVSDRLALDIVNTTYDMNHNKLEWGKGRLLVKEALDDIRINWDAFLQTNMIGEEVKLKNEAESLRAEALRAVDDLMQIASVRNETTESEFSHFIETTLYTKIDPFIAQLKKLMDVQIDIAHDVFHESEDTFKRTVINLIIIVASGLIIILLMAIFVIRTFGKSLEYTNDIISKIADGNLNIEIERQGKDEIGILLSNIDKMKLKLREVISFISGGSAAIARASSELNAAARQLAQGASEQAASIEEISASVEEMSANIQQNLINAHRTEQVSVKAASEISSVEHSSAESLKKIREIAEKITVIGSISFQTHILALNAAIEAARAGQHGKGFGVVASEVGKLAERSKVAAVEIDKLAQNSVKVTENAGSLLRTIVPDIVSTSQFVQEITAANNEQSIGADQINEGVQQLNQVTQQNAASSEELSSHADELASQAEDLLKIIEYFDVDGVGNSQQLTKYKEDF